MHKLLPFIALLAFAACTDDFEATRPAAVTTGDTIEVPLHLVASEITTRAIDDPIVAGDPTKDGIGATIKDVHIIQFEGTDNNAVIQTHAFIQDYADATQRTIKLIASENQNYIVAIANVGDDAKFIANLGEGMTLADLKSRVKTVKTQQQLFDCNEPAPGNTGTFPTDNNYRVPLNGMITVERVNTSTPVSIQLKRPISRINFTLKLKKSLGLEVQSMELYNVPDLMYYFTNYDPLPATMPNIAFNSMTYSKPVTWVTDDTDETYLTHTVRYYVPANRRGAATNTEGPGMKKAYAPGQSMYMKILATKNIDGRDQAYIYTLYLGEDLLQDFNINPNHKYIYEVAINTLNSDEADMRVEDFTDVDFTPLELGRANCYILNPPPYEGLTRHYRIPVDRIDEFWGAAYSAEEKDEAPYEWNHGNCLFTGGEWTADVVWADIKVNPTLGEESTTQVSLVKHSGSGRHDYFEVSVPCGAEGNVVIGVKKPNTDILWSWHLWITPYNPYPCRHYTVRSTQNDYEVPGGKVYHPIHNTNNGTGWISGLYKNAFIMDRAIGELTTNAVAHYGSTRGSIYYQYGRKDPFFPGTKYDRTGTVVQYTQQTGAEISATTNTQAYGVQHPMVGIHGVVANKYNPSHTNYATKYIWHDPMVEFAHYHKAAYRNVSIFDPSPLGFSLPTTNTFPNGQFNVSRYFNRILTYGFYDQRLPISNISTSRHYLNGNQPSYTAVYYQYANSSYFWNGSGNSKNSYWPIVSVTLNN